MVLEVLISVMAIIILIAAYALLDEEIFFSLVMIGAFLLFIFYLLPMMNVHAKETYYNRQFVCKVKDMKIKNGNSVLGIPEQTSVTCEDSLESFVFDDISIPITKGTKLKITTHHHIEWDKEKPESWKSAVDSFEQNLKTDESKRVHNIKKSDKDVVLVSEETPIGLIMQ